MTKKRGRKPRVSMAKCRDRLKWLARKLGRPVGPKDVVKDARTHKDAAYHRWFTWNVRKAAEERWLDQARQLLGRIKVVYRDAAGNAVKAREYLSLIQEEGATQTFRRGYIERPEVLSNVDLKRQCVEQAKTELETWKNRWRTFAEIEATFPVIDTAILQLQKTRFRKIAGGRPKRGKRKAK